MEYKRLADCGIYVERRHTGSGDIQSGREKRLQDDRLFQAINNPALLPSFILVTPHQLKFPESNFNKVLNGLCENDLVHRFIFDEIHMLLGAYEILKQLPILREKYPHIPITVLSAEPKKFPLDRPNLYYQVLPKSSQGEDDKLGVPTNPKERSQIAPIIYLARAIYPSGAGIVYSRKKVVCRRFAEILNREGISAAAYDSDSRRSAEGREIFRKWKENDPDVRVLVSTTTLSSGVHKSDVRFVVHTSFPTTGIDGYMQETGRAGRDGKPATCLLLYAFGDAFQVAHSSRFQTECILALLWLVNSTNCRRRALLSYYEDDFFEYESTNHRCCDVCDGMTSGRPHLEVTSLAGRVLEYIRDSYEERQLSGGTQKLAQALNKRFNGGRKEPTVDMWVKLIQWLIVEQFLEVHRPGEMAGGQVKLVRNDTTNRLIEGTGPRVHLPWSMRFGELHVRGEDEDFQLKWTEEVIRSLDEPGEISSSSTDL
ncbi:Bloom syndrome protein homolog [Rhizoctonia solani]|uniref:DNA 3'-5' helicase n=1 Tax=Rhizoctonia solani TaxID=456999 RepID=A0A0K6G995_9AGAM|nr:Bloom syndrome protein homolog [Rhizoctonia solani]